MKQSFLLMVMLVLLTTECFSQGVPSNSTSNKTVTLVTSGSGSTKDEATKNALRSAIEQTYGTFVSANTQVVNDELIKDEIITISSGNIIGYDIISTNDISNGVEVTVKAIVSPDKLVSFAKSKGMKTELAGATFAMNIKMKQLNEKNEIIVLQHLETQLTEVLKQGIFDYEIISGEPQKDIEDYLIPLTINIKENQNTKSFFEVLYNTLSALSLSYDEWNNYKRTNYEFYSYDKYLNPISYKEPQYEKNNFHLRTPFRDSFDIERKLLCAILKFNLKDNIGNSFLVNIVENSSSIDHVTSNGARYKWYDFGNFSIEIRSRIPVILKKISYPGSLPNNKRRNTKELPSLFPRLIDFVYNTNNVNKSEPIYTCGITLEYSLEQIEKLNNFSIEPLEDFSKDYYKIFNIKPKIIETLRENKHIGPICSSPDIIPSFPGGASAMLQYISKSMKYPKDAAEQNISGRVLVSFIVNTDGSLSDLKVEDPCFPSLDKEAIRIIKTFPTWIPGKKAGKPVRVKMKVPVSFR